MSFVYCIAAVLIVSSVRNANAQLAAPDRVPNVFDKDLYKSVLNSDLCRSQITHMKLENQVLLLRFFDLGFRAPTGIMDNLNTNDFGDYFKCLQLNADSQDPPIKGKYCAVTVPLNQDLRLPFLDGEVNGRDLLSDQIKRKGMDPEVVFKAIEHRSDDSNTGGIFDDLTFRFGVCMPQTCTSDQWVSEVYANVSAIGFKYEEEFCRLPDDRPWVAADYVAIAIFSTLAALTVASTCYDLHCTFTLKKDTKQISPLLRSFSVYTNTRRLTTFSSNANTLDCLDGIRAISMMWVILGHTFSMYNTFVNLLEVIDFLVSTPATLVQSGVFAVDTFLTMTGILLIYTSVGKMTTKSLLKTLHLFYINRIMRLFPLLGAIVLLEASVFHRIADGPYWLTVARNVERCRNWWWSTILYVQNYVNPNDICIQHSWYLAIDMQLHIISPLILVWVYSGRRRLAWAGLTGGILAVLVASTVFNFMFDLPSSNASLVRLAEQADYMEKFYQNTLTRGSPFFFGMAAGYLLVLTKGKKIKLPLGFVLAAWMIALLMFSTVFYMTYEVMQLEWSNQLADNLYNSFARPIWAIALCWLIFACIHGYGGPINWALCLPMWKIPARISYAMYLFHYSFMFIAASVQIRPLYFTVAQSLFDFLGHLFLTTLTAFVVTVLIDSPFSTLTKLLLGGGQKRPRRPPPEVKATAEGQPENGNTRI
ncbi:nose resistant to fluoxetine protein 6 isoform X1 [Pieris rapae]|uniref:nose resistant to fluoxetine protein 6 isoform X1 n=1 Tax=Pieris rapae TaxID=64459 RepID=UPI001E27C915|nr:nose resistant to fluoxetine protein 6 isoform X1 [Pieris rapae]XP_045485660.1 nose resistant to fluoxetine protein 6 isoform X1 [Pieris rapae]